MFYPDQIEQKIGFDKLRQILKGFCYSKYSAAMVDRMKPSKSFDLIYSWLQQTREFQLILEEGLTLQLRLEDEYELIFDKLELSNNFLEVDELFALKELITTSDKLIAFFELHSSRFPNLSECVKDLTVDAALIEKIDKLFAIDGSWKWNASKKLKELHQKETETAKSIQRNLRSVYNQCQSKGWVAETDISIKDGRLVIPILAEHKRKVEGVVQDVSGNGRVIYIEPIGTLESTNELTEIRLGISQEQKRLLRILCNQLRPYLSDFKFALNRISLLDFIRAKASLAIDLDAQMPDFHSDPTMRLVDARHPLLIVNHRDKKLPVVPLNLQLTGENRIVLVSGPNAGGKSVALKTVALLQFMIQSGMLIPCDPESSVGIFDNIFVDIGDDQSIESDLSSYSSHLQNMKFMLSHSNAKTLLCIDEIGVGTDPQFGRALAAAMLEKFAENGTKGIVTTHYGNLKSLADKTDGLINGRMNFDADEFKPLFTLEIGKPGSSFAFELAERTGLSKSLLKSARSRVDVNQERADRLLAKLDMEKASIDLLKHSAEKEEAAMAKMKTDYQALKKELDSRKKEILENAQIKALKIIEDANAKVENTIRKIREEGASKLKTKHIRKNLEKSKANLKTEISSSEKLPQDIKDRVFKVGDQVRIKGSESTASIVEIRKDKALVVAGIIKSTVKFSDLELASEPKMKEKTKANVKNVLLTKERDFEMEKDIRGMRMHEALKAIDDWIDTALMLGIGQLRLIHGKGDGILKQAIRDHLKNQNYIKRIQYEHIELGGEGVSLIELQ